MKIHIKTSTGTGRTYTFDVELSATVQWLKQLLHEKTGNDEDLQTVCLTFNGELLEDDEKTLLDYGIQADSRLQLVDLSVSGRGDLGFMGLEFLDVSNSTVLKQTQWSKTAPRWRVCPPGLCLEGTCTNHQCEAHNQRVIVPIGYKKFDILVGADETTTKCPLCKQYVEPKTCSFNNCWWRYKGIKQDEVGKGKPPKKCSSDWKRAGNAHHYFDEQTSEMIIWKQLILEAVKDKP